MHTTNELRELVLSEIKRSGLSERAWAKKHRMTPQGVNAFINKRQGPGKILPAVLGMKPVTRFIPLNTKVSSTKAKR